MHSRGIPLLVSLCCAIITADQHVENVARGKTYSQSSKHSVQGPSSNAANGNTSGHYDAHNCIHTFPAQQGNHWWQVDLGGTFPVYNITVWARDGLGGSIWNDRLYPFTITVDNKTCVSVPSPGPATRRNLVTCSSVMYGRVVRLNVTVPGQMLNLCEFKIFDCKAGWWGLNHCQQKCPSNCVGGTCRRADGTCLLNVATGKTYRQISTYTGDNQGAASNAADGNTDGDYTKGSCSHTGVKNTLPDPLNTFHWWEVDLGGTYPVHDITVWARDDDNGGMFNDRLYPFTITVDNTTCVSVTSAPSTRHNSVTCTSAMYGRVVRLTLDRTDQPLNLCEFQVFVPVCPEGFYGPNCSSPCDMNCEGGCDRTSGRCTRCMDGLWGSQLCHQNCSTNCAAPTCQRDNGNCEACREGFHGPNCSYPCDQDCDGGCDKTSGHCTRCKSGSYGPHFCHGICPAKCAGGTCQRATGDCDACPNGQYGKFCNMSCSSGCGQCDQDSGNCTACKDNLVFPDCSDCVDGYYKQSAPPCIQCPGTCDNNTSCDKTTGHCDECPPGKKGDTCNEACDDNTYGQNCSERCGQCKGKQPCDTVTGSCTTGCEPGYIGELCNDKCQPGFYGEGCSRPCGYCQVNTTCHHQDGHCLAGCVSGFAEPLCLQVQVKQESWVMPVVGSLAAALLITIGAVAIVCWCRRSREETEDNHQREAPPVEPESTQDPHHPSSAPPISDADTTVYEIIDNDDAEEMHVQENNYESPHPYSNDDADRALYMQLSPPASDDTS